MKVVRGSHALETREDIRADTSDEADVERVRQAPLRMTQIRQEALDTVERQVDLLRMQ